MAANRSSSGLFLLFIYLCQCLYSVESELWTEADSRKLKQLRRDTKVSKTPCSCDGKTRVCTCCAKFAIDGKSADKGCASFVVPDGKGRNQLVRYSFNFKDQSTSSMMPAGRDPKGMCQPFNRFPGVQVCSRFYSTKVEDGKVKFCLTMEGKYQGYTFYQMDFDCVTYNVENQKQVGTK